MTTTFACTNCNTIDIDPSGDSDGLCFECKNGHWHGLFEKEEFDPNVHMVDNTASVHDEDDLGVESFG